MRGTTIFGPLVLAALSAAAVPGRGTQQEEKPRKVTCSFSNPSYAGYCRQDASVPEGRSPEEVCQGILKCLNDVRCVQTYCNATEIRGNWKLEAVEAKDEKK